METVELETTTYGRPAAWVDADLVDADVHVSVPSLKALFPYLDDRWRDYITESGMGGLDSGLYPANAPNMFVPGSKPESGPAGSSLALTQSQLLEPWGTKYAILNCAYAVDSVHNDDLAAAIATAVNRWQLEEWLQQDSRLRGSALLPVQNPALAVEEIERIAQQDEFVQVLVPARSREPLGRRGFWPIYEAAQRHGLAVGVQAGGINGLPITPVGWPSYYIEDYVSLSQAFQSQVMSLVSEGVFAEFPDLRVVMIEGGFTWLPSLMWRFDKNWKGLRREIPWVKVLPSEIIRDRFRLTVQPLDEPENPQFMLDIVEQIDCDEMLLFATDYPHLQFDTSEAAMPAGISAETQAKILGANAISTYRL